MNVVPHVSPPEVYLVTVVFKPLGIDPWESDERREVTFEATRIERAELYDTARLEIVSQNILSKYTAATHWEPYQLAYDYKYKPSDYPLMSSP